MSVRVARGRAARSAAVAAGRTSVAERSHQQSIRIEHGQNRDRGPRPSVASIHRIRRTMRGPSAVAAIAAATTLAVEVRSWSVSPISIGLTKLQNPRPQRRHHDRLPSTNNERRSRRPAVAGTALHSGSSDDVQHQLRSMGLNELQTQFRLAIAREDMDAAILFRDELADRVR